MIKLQPHVSVLHRHKMLRMNHTKLERRSQDLVVSRETNRDPGNSRGLWNANLVKRQPEASDSRDASRDVIAR